MSDTLMTVIAIFLGATLMFVFPLMSVSERNDDISELGVQALTDDFVNNIKTTGVITRRAYDSFVQSLGATGNTYDVEMEAKILDKNLNVKYAQADKTKIGENIYYSIYTTQIEDELDNDTGGNRYRLKEGDLIYVSVKNTNQTMAQMLRSFFYRVTGNDTYEIAAQNSGMITTNGR